MNFSGFGELEKNLCYFLYLGWISLLRVQFWFSLLSPSHTHTHTHTHTLALRSVMFWKNTAFIASRRGLTEPKGKKIVFWRILFGEIIAVMKFQMMESFLHFCHRALMAKLFRRHFSRGSDWPLLCVWEPDIFARRKKRVLEFGLAI